MVRAPCCEKMGLKKGPWSLEEDQILINYIHSHGHNNWRALPKQAGLLRCGKSCRLRWTNYLRPDIKRGNFTREEEDTIIKLHETLGNRWSAIAARLPGRTDNEIKNVWHTHLKKRLPQNQQNHDTKRRNPNHIRSSKRTQRHHHLVSDSSDDDGHVKPQDYAPLSPPQCSSASDSTLTNTTDINNEHNSGGTTTNDLSTVETQSENNNVVEPLDEDFWSEVLSADKDQHFPFQLSPVLTTAATTSTTMCDGFSMDFWYNVYRAEELPEL